MMKYGEFGPPPVYGRSDMVHGIVDSNELVTEKRET